MNKQSSLNGHIKPLYSLVSLEKARATLGFDERENEFISFLLLTSTYSIESYCNRRLRLKRHRETFRYYADTPFVLREYPVRNAFVRAEKPVEKRDLWFEPGLGEVVDAPYSVTVAGSVGLCTHFIVRVDYIAGYSRREVPPDLALACLELAHWNYGRQRDKRVGIEGVRKGETLTYEKVMPENVKALLKRYRRKVW
jgi:hypothetical protein